MQRPPPLQLLPAFDAAARHQSFSKAALELHVTAAAISQQMRQLESHLGMKLFHRLTRRVTLTDAGEVFAKVVSQTLATYRQGHADLLHRHNRPVLRINMTPLIAHGWLLPRLGEFQSAHPNLDVRIESSMDLVDFDHRPVDVALRVGNGPWAGLNSWPLCDCEVVALASVELMAQRPVHSWADLKDHVLIHPRQSHLDWSAFAALSKAPALKRRGDLMMDSDLAAWRAAEQGLGVTVCMLPKDAAREAMQRDGLVRVLTPAPLPVKAHFVFRADSGKEDLLKSTYEWVLAHLCILTGASVREHG